MYFLTTAAIVAAVVVFIVFIFYELELYVASLSHLYRFVVNFRLEFFPYLYRLRCNTAGMDFNVQLTLLPLVVIAVA